MDKTTVPKEVVFYHGAFVHYITPNESTAQPQDQNRASASLKKLAGFSESHLIELSSDMYDELQRRLSPEGSKIGPLGPRNDIHWKRNDARKHVGSLPDHRFRDICRDLVTEQERRYSELKTGPTYPLQDAMPMSGLAAHRSQKSFTEQRSKSSSQNSETQQPALQISTDQVKIQSINESNITPTKVRVIESDSDSEDDQTTSEIKTTNNFKVPIINKDFLPDLSDDSNTDYELDDSESLINRNPTGPKPTTQSTPEPLTGHHSEDPMPPVPTVEPTVESHAKPVKSIDNDANDDNTVIPQTPSKDSYPISPPSSQTKETYQSLSNSNSDENTAELEFLRAGLKEQRHVTEQVRREAARFLDEMRALTEQHEQQISRADILDTEVSHWKSRHARVSKELEKTRASRLDTAIKQQQLFVTLPQNFVSSHGKVVETHLRACLSSISVLIAAVHNNERTQNLLDLLHRVVLSSREISSDNKLIAHAVKQLISSVRNYTVSSGLFPQMIVNSACSDLSMAIVEYVKEVKVIPEHSSQISRKEVQFAPEPQLRSTIMPAVYAGTDNSDSADSHKDVSARRVDSEDIAPSNKSPQSATGDITPKDITPRDVAVQDNTSKDNTTETTSPDSPLTTYKSYTAIKKETDNNNSKMVNNLIDNDKLRVGSINNTNKNDTKVQSKQLDDNSLDNMLSNKSTVSAPEKEFKPQQMPSVIPVASNKDVDRTNGPVRRPQQGPDLPVDESVKALQTYLEEQTSGTVESIGALLSGIKSNAPAGELKPLIAQIKVLVGHMIEATNDTMRETRSLVLKNKGTFIVQNLSDCLERMDMLRSEELDAIRDDAKPNRHLKQRLAGVNFDMAKSTKELVKTVEEVVLQDEVDHIDRQLA